MALVAVARFADLIEAQAAAAALRASDIPVLVQNEHWGQANFTMQIAMGGFTLWTPEEEAADARAFIVANRIVATHAVDPQADDVEPPAPSEGGAAWAALALVSMLGLGPIGGWAVASLKRRPTLGRFVVVGLFLLLVILVFWAVVSLSSAHGD